MQVGRAAQENSENLGNTSHHCPTQQNTAGDYSSNRYTHSSDRILHDLVDRDFDKFEIDSQRRSNKNANKQSNINAVINSKLSKLHKDFGHLDELLQIQHHRGSGDAQYRQHRISNMDSYSKYDDEDNNNINVYNNNINNNNNIINSKVKEEYKQTQKKQYTKPQQQTIINNYNAYQQQMQLFTEEQTKQEQKQKQKQNGQQQQFIDMIIQIDSQHSVTLKVHINDDPVLLAKKFCYTHNIDPQIINTLAKQIKQLQLNIWMHSISNNNNNNNVYSNSNNKVSNKHSNQHTHHNNSQVSHTSISTKFNADNMPQKQNKQILSNTNNNTNHNNTNNNNNNNKNSRVVTANKISSSKYQIEQQSQSNTFSNVDTGRKTMFDKTNTKSNSRVNYLNNTKSNINITHHSINTSLNNINNNNNNNNVFDRLYRNSQTKIKKTDALHKQKEKATQFQSQLRNYNHHNTSMQNLGNKFTNHTTDKTKQSILNQSTTFIHNLSTENNNNTTNSKNVYYQVKIYEKNTKLQKQSRIRSQCLKQQLENQKQYQCTKNPAINPLSRLIVQKIREQQYSSEDVNNSHSEISNMKNSHIRMYQRSSLSKQKNVARTISYVKQKEQRQMKQCTFRPNILKKSQCQTLNTQRYLLLHEDFYIRQNKAHTVKATESKKIFEQQHPQINEISKKLIGNRSFQERMVEYKANAEKNKSRLQKEKLSLQKHKPSINKNADNKKQRNVSIGQYLYSKSLQKKQPYAKNEEISNNKIVPNKSSNAMYEQMKRNAFRYIFTLMDNDEDGYISNIKINILGLETQILQLLAPLLCEMQEVKIELDQDEFVDALQRLFNTFSVHEKNMILNVYKNPLRKSRTIQQPSFHPSLNQKSIELAKDLREPGISLYELGRQKEYEKQTKLQQLRALKALIQFQECTFYPNLLHHH